VADKSEPAEATWLEAVDVAIAAAEVFLRKVVMEFCWWWYRLRRLWL
jgi:hypothetical protein